MDDEWGFEAIDTTSVDFQFENCIIKSDTILTGNRYINCSQSSRDNLFTNPTDRDYTLSQISLAVNFGKPSVGFQVPLDLAGNARTLDSAPDAGCFEFQ